MKTTPTYFLTAVTIWIGIIASCARADEMVTIPKARLQALERKEKELEAMKGTVARVQQEKEQMETERQRLKQEAEKSQKAWLEAEKRATALASGAANEKVIAHETPPLSGLAPLKKGEEVDAMDLMNHYRADAASAKARYETQRIRVRGKVTGFEKAAFIRPYEILLQTTEREWKIICRVDPPEKMAAVFPAKHGEELMGSTSSGSRMTLAKVGQTVVVEGRSKGLKDQNVLLTGATLIGTE